MVQSKLEQSIYDLSLDDQLILIERLVQHIRYRMDNNESKALQLAEMANDPEIQNEMRLIESEFSGTENDGLESV